MSAYRGLAPWYDALTGDVPYGAFADFYEAVFRLYGRKPKLLLDLACGTGTLTVELARRGFEMIGVDGSEEMLSQAFEKASAEAFPVRPMFLCQKMEELDLYGTVEAAVCSLDGFNYLTPDALRETLRRLRLFIEPGGLLIFDVFTPERLRALDGQVFLDEREDVCCIWRASFEEETNALFYGMDVFSRERANLWRREREEHIEYAHSESFLRDALRKHGFGGIRLFGELRTEPPRECEERIFFAAVRE